MDKEHWQRYSPQAHSKPPFFRVTWPNEPNQGGISTRGEVIPIPEFGAMAYNFIVHRNNRLEWYNLKEPKDFDGHKMVSRVNYVRDDGVVMESFFFPEEYGTGQQLIDLVLGLHRAELQKIRKEPTAPQACIESAKQAALSLLQRDYPNYFAVYNQLCGDTSEEARKRRIEAFILDTTRIHGSTPKVDKDLKLELWNDDFFKAIARSMSQCQGRAVNKLDWHLVSLWIDAGYYQMTVPAIAKALETIFPGNTVPNDRTLSQRIHRLGLQTTVPRGNPGL